ncbi:hypothetical protein PMIT1313_00060 [Prochlorococcus marinus str. MIT 1313]|uniref:hypothetical protein n=2 Tax=Prochlorococcus TaxID=1218 RepID=UPI0007B3CC5D|nr:hypothetical protein [Prochlorococcus marinus]KZR72704.1 hypothetical protein PMIT1313_00060 [Prochlorococcus marinus str. MIT 1313]
MGSIASEDENQENSTNGFRPLMTNPTQLGASELREEMLVLEKYWERGIELHSVGVLNGEEFEEWGAVCMSAMLLMGMDGLRQVLKMNREALAAPRLEVESGFGPPPSRIG